METSTHQEFIKIVYGSKLYGTDTPQSDTDVKVVFLPNIGSLLLCEKQKPYKARFDANGDPLSDNVPMPANGIETENIPIQTFVRDFVQGQTYALEIAHGVLSKGIPEPGLLYTSEIEAYRFCVELIHMFGNRNVYSMTSFAQKQTLDYVHRGERLVALQQVLSTFHDVNSISSGLRLDDSWSATEKVLDHVAGKTGLPIGTLENNGKIFRSLELNGRSYLDSTAVSHIINVLEKQVAAYGDRSVEAAGKPVEWKSMSHAIRVYEQAIELLDTGKISFPRSNAQYLKAVKQGQVPFELVKEQLKLLDEQVIRKQAESGMREKTPELEKAAEIWLLDQLYCMYGISFDEQD